jgi:hypothetical protein
LSDFKKQSDCLEKKMENPSVVVKKIEGKEFSCDLVIEDRPIPEIDDGSYK